jgi:hypothetical protein
MNRTLKRPMFRIGGKADGITSGLDRPGYSNGSTADIATGDISRDEIIAQAMADAKKFSQSEPMSRNEMLGRFLIPFGLNFASATPSGSILADAARSAVDPAAQLAAAIDKRRDTKTEKEADLFSAFLTSGLSERKQDKKLAAEKLKDSQELLTLYDNELEKNVIVKAGDIITCQNMVLQKKMKQEKLLKNWK